MEPDYSRNQGRGEMIERQLQARGIRDPAVLRAMSQVPRHHFVPEEEVDNAYADRALAIGCGQTISQPYIVAYMTEMLELRPHHKVLEVGTGSGYQTAILAGLCGEVYTVECCVELAEAARERLQALGCRGVHFRIGDGTTGWSEAAPFDRIMVTAGAPRVPEPLVSQLCEAGRLMIPIGPRGVQRLTLVERRRNRWIEFPGIGCRFVKLIGRHGWSAA